MDAQSGSRVLNAANDLVEMLRLAQSAAERVAQEVYGVSYEHAELIERELQRLRRSADRLQKTVEDYVSREEGASVERGHPMRRAGDHH
ncbi:MAG TPA: hypothetical protein VGJ74_07070 [Burkholderiales bacterium]|jgi:hypothetical protein